MKSSHAFVILAKVGISIILGILLSACVYRQTTFTNFKSQHPHTLRVATYNVNAYRYHWSSNNPLATVKTLAALNADIIALQEATPFWHRIINRYIGKKYPYQQFHPYPDSGGLAILSKYPFKTLAYLTPGPGRHPSWIVQIRSPLGKIQLVNAHFTPSLNKFDHLGFLFYPLIAMQIPRHREAKYVCAKLNPHRTIIIAGDFNEGDKGNAVRYFRNRGLIDALLQNQRQFTWHWPIFGHVQLTNRFDTVFYSPNLIAKRVQVLQEGDSDHYPVIVDFSA